MFVTFILGLIAAWGAPYAEDRLKAALDNVLLDDTPVSGKELSLLSFAACLLGAAIASMIIGVPHAAPLALGAVAGVFGPKFLEKWRASKTPDYDS